ncbi:hypothetical protein WJX73_008201 [Symbiochloris irregularis]|uniref:Cyclic nucleotide-binding domain-containing protein n=1 Tax=Symbiochloris irregularis TaxID=706552 RepID=A0AAW1NSI3_9CHLO
MDRSDSVPSPQPVEHQPSWSDVPVPKGPSKHASCPSPRMSRMSGSVTTTVHPAQDYDPWSQFVSRTFSVQRRDWEKWTSDSAKVSADLRFSSGLLAPSPSPNPADRRFRWGHSSVCGLPIISPYNYYYHKWAFIILLLDLSYAAFVVPIGVGFSVLNTQWTWVAVCDFVAGMMYTANMFLNLHVGFVVTYNLQKKVVLDGKKIARVYITSGGLLLDILSVIPWLAQVTLIIAAANGHKIPPLQHSMQVLRLLRLGRLSHLLRRVFMESIGGATHSFQIFGVVVISTTWLYVMQILYAMAVVINLVGCLWYWTASTEGITNTWITHYAPFQNQYGDDDGYLDKKLVSQRIPKAHLYLTSIYWALTTIVTVGYGDITPYTAPEQGVAIIVMIVGILFFGILLGSIGDMLQRATKSARKAAILRDKMANVENWLRNRMFPKALRNSIRAYYAEVWIRQAEEGDEEAFFTDLPHSLRHEAVWHLTSRALLTLPLFRGLEASVQEALVNRMRPRRELPGRYICQQGEAAARLWILTEGRVAVVMNGEEGQTEGDPAVLGETALLQDQSPHFNSHPLSFRTEGACTLWELDAAEVMVMFKQWPHMWMKLQAAARTSFFSRVANWPRPWPPSLAIELETLRSAGPEGLVALMTEVRDLLMDVHRVVNINRRVTE